MISRLRNGAHALALALASAMAPGCGASPYGYSGSALLADLRASGPSSSDADVVGRWTLGELFAPGGSAERAAAGRKRLDALAQIA